MSPELIFYNTATMAQYREHAERLNFLSRYIRDLDISICKAHGKRYSIVKTRNKIDCVRNILENRMFAEHPTEADIDVFYGKQV